MSDGSSARKAIIAECEAAHRDGSKKVEQQHRQLRDLRLLMRQIEAELQQLAPRHSEREDHVRLLEASPTSFTAVDVREAYAALSEVSNRRFLLQTQMDSLRQREQTLSQDATQIERLVALLERLTTSFPETGLSAPGDGAISSSTNGAALAARFVEAREGYGQQVSQQLLSGPVQALSNLVLQAEVSLRLLSKDRERAAAEIRELKQSLVSSLGELRRFAGEMAPPALAELGLRATARRFADEFSARHKVPVELTVTEAPGRLPLDVQLHLFRVLQESLHALRAVGPVRELRIALALDANPARLDGLAAYLGAVDERAQLLAEGSAASAYTQAHGGHLSLERTDQNTIRVSATIPHHPAT